MCTDGQPGRIKGEEVGCLKEVFENKKEAEDTPLPSPNE
jgi:hypothetical protein